MQVVINPERYRAMAVCQIQYETCRPSRADSGILLGELFAFGRWGVYGWATAGER